jgi:hypothetical protein
MQLPLPWPWSSPKPAETPLSDQTKPALHHYDRPGVAPPSARVDPNLKVAQRDPVRLWHLWKYGFVVVSKGAAAIMTRLTSRTQVPSLQQRK